MKTFTTVLVLILFIPAVLLLEVLADWMIGSGVDD
jgi:hypothetical protein